MKRGLTVATALFALVWGGVQQSRINDLEQTEMPAGTMRLIESQEQQLIDLHNAVAAMRNQQLADEAQTSASVTTVPAGPYCNLHDIAVQNPGC